MIGRKREERAAETTETFPRGASKKTPTSCRGAIFRLRSMPVLASTSMVLNSEVCRSWRVTMHGKVVRAVGKFCAAGSHSVWVPPRRAAGARRPLGFILTGGEASYYDVTVRDLLAMPVATPSLFLTDKGHDSDALHQELLIHGIRRFSLRGLTARPPRLWLQSLEGPKSYRSDVQSAEATSSCRDPIR